MRLAFILLLGQLRASIGYFISGLTSGIAEIGSEASISGTVNAGTLDSEKWGTTSGGSELGTGTNPTSMAAAEGGTLYWTPTISGVEQTPISAEIYHPTPTASAASNQSFDINTGEQTYDLTSLVTFAGTLVWSVIEQDDAVTVPAGVATFDTDSMAVQSATQFTFRAADAANSARFVDIVFTVTISATAPAAFVVGDWSIADLGTSGDARITIATLPADNGSAITDLERKVGAGAWTSLGGTTTGTYDVAGFTDSVSTNVLIRAVNAVGNGADSDTKSVTTTAGATAPAQFGTGDWSIADAGLGSTATITITTLPSDGGSALTDLEAQIDGGSWVSLGGTSTGAYNLAGFTDSVSSNVAIRAVNGVGNGTASATKSVTTSSDNTAPTFSGDSFNSSTVTLTSTVVEASGSVDLIWATSDTGVSPVANGSGGWTGTTYETGTISSIAAGAISETIPITGTTPTGADRKLSVYYRDAAGNDSTVGTYTLPMANPAISSSDPADDSTDHPIADSIVITFDRNISFGTGNIVLRENDGGFADLESFNVATEQGTGAGQVSISGAVLTINPTSDLTNSREYAIRIDATAIDSTTYGASFAGIADDTTLSFTAEAAAVAEFAYVDADVSTSSATSFTFSAAALGTADAGRYILVAVAGNEAANGKTDTMIPDSVTVGGQSATLQSPAGGYPSTGIHRTAYTTFWWVNVTTGTTGDVVVNFGTDTSEGCAVTLYRAVGFTVQAVEEDWTSADPKSISLPVTSGGKAVLAMSSWTTALTSVSVPASFGTNLAGADSDQTLSAGGPEECGVWSNTSITTTETAAYACDINSTDRYMVTAISLEPA